MSKAIVAQVESLFESSPVPAAAVGRNRRVVFANPALMDLLQLEESPVGQTCYDMLRAEGPEGLPLCSPACRRLQKSVGGELLPPTLMWCPVNGGHPALIEGGLFPIETKNGGDSGLVLYLFRPVEAGAELKRVVGELSGLHQTTKRGSPSGTASGVRRASPLSEREAEVLALLQEGLSTRDIGSRLDISPATVRNHIQRVLGKLKVHTRLQAVVAARRNGWL